MSLAPASQREPPGDEDLQELYNSVLAGFAEDSPTNTLQSSHLPQDRDIEQIIGNYQARAPLGGHENFATSPTSLRSPVGNHDSRRLPPPPRTSYLNTQAMSMPEARPYQIPRQPQGPLPPLTPPPPPPPHIVQAHRTYSISNNASFADGQQNSNVALASNGRRPLPSTPLGRSEMDSSSSNLPPINADSRARLHSQAAVNPPNANPRGSPSPSLGSQSGSSVPISTYYTDAPPTAVVQPPSRAISVRPKGAQAPMIPGSVQVRNGQDRIPSQPSSPMFVPSSTPAIRMVQPEAEFHPRLDLTSGPTSLMSPSLAAVRVNNSGLDFEPFVRPSSDQSGTSNYANNSVDVARNASIGSAFSQQTASTVLTPSTSIISAYPNGAYAGSSTTTVDRGNSYKSFASSSEYSAQQRPLPNIASQSRQPTYSNVESDVARTVRSDEYQRSIEVIKGGPLGLHDEDEDYDEEYDLDDDEDDNRYVNLALLSHIAVRLKDKVPRGTHVKGGIPYPHAFTGKDVVSTIQALIQRELLINLGISTVDRRIALQVARSLQSQLFFYEVEWGGKALHDSVEDVYMFLDDQEGGSAVERAELPTGVFPALTKCYACGCVEGRTCYAYSCPRSQESMAIADMPPMEAPSDIVKKDWKSFIDPEVLKNLPESEIHRQTIIYNAISKEELYVRDLDVIETLFMKPLRTADPPVIPYEHLDDFIDEVFSNVLDIRECNRRLLEVLAVRQREQYPIIQRIGDIFLHAASEFRTAYPIYVGNLPAAEKRWKDEVEHNSEFKRWLEQRERQPEARHLNLKHFLNRPSEHLHKYTVLLDAILKETSEGNPDAEFLAEAMQAIARLSVATQLRTFQTAMGKVKFEWQDLVPPDELKSIPKQEKKRQAVMFELITTEMEYVKDLESIRTIFIQPLQRAQPPIIAHDRLQTFLNEVFHNYEELLVHHRKLLDQFHEIQRDEHPLIRSLAAPLLDAVLNWRDAYMEYVPNYPIAWYRIDEEASNNLAFKSFFDQATRHPNAKKLDMKSFVHRPIPRLLRYDLLLKTMLKETPPNHEDMEAIPQVVEVIQALGKETDTGIAAAKEKVEIWGYNSNLVFKAGEAIDMDLLNENRSLIHTGKLLRQPDNSFENWTELFVLLFDNYLVFTKPRERDGVTKYNVNRRPIPIDLLTPLNFTDPPQRRAEGVLGRFGGGGGAKNVDRSGSTGATGNGNSEDSRAVYPCTIHHNGRLGGHWTVYAESGQARQEWKQKLDEAITLRRVVTDANKVFEVETLSSDTFIVPSIHGGAVNSSWNDENTFTGKVTCSIPFSTTDGRGLVAIGCAEGVWIGLRHDPRSMRRVLHLKMVTQCAMLEDFGIFLVLADKSLFAYHIEALVPSNPPSANATRTPQKLNGSKDVQFFSVGTLGGRTLIIYMKRKGLDSVFRVLEPVTGKIGEKPKAAGGLSRFGFGSQRSDWFRVYRDFFLPSESYDLIFLKARIAILCSKGFEIMDLSDFKSVTIPQRDDPRLQPLIKRIESCKPLGMFRSSEDEFLLCYDEFGMYVNRHGDPVRSVGTIEWEGTAERVAWHPPYILLFDSRFIEVRHVETGRLAQIIPGNDVRCIWDGRGSSQAPVATPGPDGWQDASNTSSDSRVHGVMKATEPSSRGSRASAQHVFQLVPTIPLYLPESLSSPHHTTYFPDTSPTHSPSLKSRNSWK